jgi:hypothetical protein
MGATNAAMVARIFDSIAYQATLNGTTVANLRSWIATRANFARGAEKRVWQIAFLATL